jgi:tetratricopeptide (TPR) repeat protein
MFHSLAIGVLVGVAGAPALPEGDRGGGATEPRKTSRDSVGAYAAFVEGLQLRSRGRSLEALAAFRRAAAHDPLAPDILAEVARTLRDQTRYQEAVREGRAAQRLAPERADLRMLVAQIRLQQGQTGAGVEPIRQAAAEYEEAARLDPQDPEPLRDLTRVYAALRDSKGALGAWNRLRILDPMNAEAALQVAQLSLNIGDQERARQALEDHLRLRPGHARAHSLLGDLKLQAQRENEAVGHYEEAARLDPDDLPTQLKLGDLYLRARRFDDAHAKADAVLRADPSNRFGRDLRARTLKESGNLGEAIEIARSLDREDPKDLKASFLLATLLEATGDWAGAEAKILAVLGRDRSSESAKDVARNDRVFRAHLGIVRQQTERHAEAAEAFGDAATSGDEPDPQLIVYRIEALLAATRYEDALRESRDARANFKGSENATDFAFTEAEALRRLDRKEDALKIVEALSEVARRAGDVETLLAAGDFHLRARRIPAAETAFREALSADLNSARAAFGLGGALERQGRYEEAEKEFLKVIASAPRSAAALNYLGYMNANRNVRVAEALALIDRALEVEPGNGAFLDSRGWALYRLGRFTEAERDIRRALTSQGNNAVVLAHLGHVLEALGRHDEAASYWTRALGAEDEDGELDREDVERRLRTRGKR